MAQFLQRYLAVFDSAKWGGRFFRKKLLQTPRLIREGSTHLSLHAGRGTPSLLD
jgi:hypothetical protein